MHIHIAPGKEAQTKIQTSLIRRFIPKGTDIGRISKKTIKWIETWINNYPRRILAYKSAIDMAAS